MPTWENIQRSFAGGEVSGRMIMRDDWQGHAESLLQMVNFMPTLQGTAVRTPGSRYIETLSDLDARIIPYMSPFNDRAIVIINPASAPLANDGVLSIRTGLTELLAFGTGRSGGIQANALQDATPIINQNSYFVDGFDGWLVDPVIDGDSGLGWDASQQGVLMGTARAGFSPNEPVLLIFQSTTLEQNTTLLNFNRIFKYADNFSGTDGTPQFTLKIALGTTPGGDDIWSEEYDETNLDVGQRISLNKTIETFADDSPLSLLAGSAVHISLALTAIGTGNKPSTPLLIVSALILKALYQLDAPATDINTSPYLASELKDLHFVQSPYPDQNPQGDIVGQGKELVITHPNHPPYWLRFNGVAYEFVSIDFENEGGSPHTPDAWSDGNYPATCGAMSGRLILAGSTVEPIPGALNGSSTETVWGSEVGRWDVIYDPNHVPTTPTASDPIRFTAIYRSPIRWVFGEKVLLIGAQEMEYVASAEGVLQAADLGIQMHSTHGSSNVQPVGMGHSVMFPAEGGTKVRSMLANRDNEGYIAPDMNLFHPELFRSGIVRMLRLRNPQQITVVVMGNGQVALLHNDKNAGILGWSRLNLNAGVKDACVMPDKNGRDVLFLTVQRYLAGAPVLHFEAIANWTDGGEMDYLQSNVYQVISNTNIITGLDHLEDKKVQVLGDGNYLGVYKVTGGQIELLDQIGEPINVSEALVGLSMTSRMATLPIIGSDPSASKRLTSINVRGIFSSRPLINGERPPDRSPVTPMGQSEPLDLIEDYQVANLGTDHYQQVTVEENVPVRSEIIGIFGKMKGSSV